MHHTLVMPDLGMGEQQVLTSLWLVEVGGEVSEGDRLLEVVCGVVTVDLPAPASGVLIEQLVGEEEPVAAGQLLATIESD